MGGVWSKARSLGQIFVKSYYHSKGHNFDPIFIKLAHNANIDNISDKFEYGWGWVKILTQSSSNLLRMLILIISQTSLNIWVGSVQKVGHSVKS